MAKGNNEIKVKFSVFNQEFNSSMNQMREETSKLTKEFKLEQEQLKLNGSESDKLKSKVDYLSKAQDLAKKSVEETRAQLDKAKATYGENSTEVKSLEGKLLNAQIAEQKLANEVKLANDAFKDSQSKVKDYGKSLEEAGNKVGAFGEKATNIGKGFFKNVTVPIMAVGTASMLAFNEVDSGLDTITVKTGATGEAMTEFESVFNDIYGSMPFAAEAVGTAVGEVNTRFGLTGEALQSLSKDFLMFAEINDTDLNASIGKTNRLMQQWNIDSSKAPLLLDMITMSGQSTGISVDKLMDSIQQNGAALKSMGFNLEDSIILLSEFEANGVNSETALTALKKATVTYAKEGKSMTEGLQESVKKIKEAKTDTEALEEASRVFGARGATEMSTAIREGRIQLDKFGFKMEEFEGTVKDTFEGTQDPPDQMKVAMNNLNLALKDLAESIFEVLAPAIKWLGDKAKEFNAWFKELSPGVKKLIVTLGGIAAAIGPIIMFIGGIANGISKIFILAGKIAPLIAKLKAFGIGAKLSALGKTFVAVWATIKKALVAVKIALAGISMPVLIVIGVIAALAAGFIYLWKTNENFRKKVIEIWNSIKQAIANFWAWLVDLVTVKLPEGWNALMEWFNGIPQYFVDFWIWIKQKFTDGWQAIKDFFLITIPEWIENMKEWFFKLPENIALALGEFFGIVAKWAVDTWNKFVETCVNVYNSVVEWFQKLPGEVWTWLVNTYNNIKQWGIDTWNAFIETCKNVYFAVVDWFKKLPGEVWLWLVNTYNNIKQWAVDTYNSAAEGARKTIAGIIDWFKSLPWRIWEWLGKTIDKLKTFAINMKDEGINAAIEYKDGLIKWMKGIPEDMKQIGKDMIQGLWDGIFGGWGWLKNKVAWFTDKVSEGFRKGFDTHSPSRVMMEIGEYNTEGLAIGMEDKIKLAQKAATNVVNAVTGAMSPNNTTTPYVKGESIANYASTNNNNVQFIINAENSTPADTDRLVDKIMFKMNNRYTDNNLARGYK
ncbi:phage tail tape measure protein, TP901 family, core region [Clostridium amylolyticum]|uniref:Phage tail tape measure protein, TP901 family, core region n=1 Tax=Clostridium amylolyticum TaxID=1121298 RepID=A0A1M6KY63_9CLOT|nr:phage tail tape measure protein [Clostridium amylolyticum]SHJ63943.1 phage tail tape measure protein, TP901 family, core region [Clostridium amylolyticum]